MSAAPIFEVLPFQSEATGPRWLVVHLPAFRLERCGYTADQPVALIAERQNATRLVALTPAARALQLHEGMTASAARALASEVVLEPLDEVGEAVDRADLLEAFRILGDRVEAWGDDALVLEVSTVSGLYGGEQATLERVRERAEELGHRVCMALSDHPLASAALARHASRDVLVPSGHGAEALAALPFAALAPSVELAEAVRTLGVRTVAEWARLDAASVAGRYGAEGVRLHRAARGRAGPSWSELPTVAPLGLLRLPVDDELHHVDGVMAVVQQGLARLRSRLAARDLVAACIELRLDPAWGPPERVRVRIARPTRDPSLLGRMLRERVDRLSLRAPVAGLALHVPETAPDGQGQQDLLERREGRTDWSEVVARLSDVLGEDALVRARPVEAWRPERAWCPVPLAGGEAPGADPDQDDPVAVQERAAWDAPRPRPTLLRHPPRPLRVREAESGRPLALRARRGWRPLRRVRGPERLEGDWWTPSSGYQRSYWVVELPEGTAWIFHENGQWFLHGWFD